MTTLVAQGNMLVAYEERLGQGAQKFIEKVKAYPARLKKAPTKRGRSTVPQVPLPSPELREPTPERAAKATDIRRSDSPPFNAQILSPHQKFHKQLGRDVILVLDEFCEMAGRAGCLPRMAAKYDGITVDQSRSSFSHVTEAQRSGIEEFHRIWGQIGADYRRLIRELVLEEAVVGEAARSYAEIGRDLCGYSQDQPCRAAAVAALRMLAWRIQELMGGKVPVRRSSRVEA